MEKEIINTLMDLNGYSKFICDLFPNWEFVKDEMLLPDRKSGSGNGTVHIYLQTNNLAALQKCFPNYFSNKKRGLNIKDNDCPVVEHFCHVPNLVSMAAYTYQFFSCNDSVFNLIEYLKDVLAIEQNGFVKFESIFKLSTDNRPYFKQFNKKVFTRIVRSLFIGDKSAYRIRLYQNSSTGAVAAFWQIVQTNHSEYWISPDCISTSCEIDIDEVIDIKEKKDLAEASAQSALTANNTGQYEQQFRDYMKKKGRSAATIDNYAMVLNDVLPRLIRHHLDLSCETLFSTIDYGRLLDLENKLWISPPIREYDERGHRQLSAGFHRYLEFTQSLLSDEELATILFKNK